MKVKKFNAVCVVLSLLIWMMYLGGSIYADVLAPIFAVAVVALGLVGEYCIKSRKTADPVEAAEEMDEEALRLARKNKTKSVLHYILTLLSLMTMFYAFGVFSNPAYGYHMFGSGKYGYEIAFWDVGEVIPDFSYILGHNILPVLLIIGVVYCKPLAMLAAGGLAWVNILNVNTSKVFGYYEIVAAAGNNSGRETTVYNYSNTVVTVTMVLVGVMVAMALISLLVNRPKKAVFACILACFMVAGAAFAYCGYESHSAAKTYDVEALKTKIYVDTKAGSEKFQAENFTNSFGSHDTPCAYPGCTRTIVTSGDSNCCAAHANRCIDCGKYIDGDALMCMKCIEDALK